MAPAAKFRMRAMAVEERNKFLRETAGPDVESMGAGPHQRWCEAAWLEAQYHGDGHVVLGRDGLYYPVMSSLEEYKNVYNFGWS